ncbi:MAG: hypothetical protein ACLGXA_24990, partial [Acidobacteriota bacterium]
SAASVFAVEGEFAARTPAPEAITRTDGVATAAPAQMIIPLLRCGETQREKITGSRRVTCARPSDPAI